MFLLLVILRPSGYSHLHEESWICKFFAICSRSIKLRGSIVKLLRSLEVFAFRFRFLQLNLKGFNLSFKILFIFFCLRFHCKDLIVNSFCLLSNFHIITILLHDLLLHFINLIIQLIDHIQSSFDLFPHNVNLLFSSFILTHDWVILRDFFL